MASLGKFHYYSTTAPATDVGYAYPVMQAPADKAIKLTSLSLFNNSNTTNCGILFAILPATTSILNDGSYNIATSTVFYCGFLPGQTIGTSIILPSTIIGNIRITSIHTLVIPPSSILVGFPDPTANLNGSIEYRAIGYECDLDGY
jgi:hypothetical protein